MRALGEVATVADLPFVMGLDQHGPSEAKQRLRVGEDSHDAGAALDLLVEPLQGVGRPGLLPVTGREAGEGEEVFGAIAEHDLELGELPTQHPGDDIELVVNVGGIRLGEDGADGGRHHLGRALGDLGEQGAQEVDPTALMAAPAMMPGPPGGGRGGRRR
jgi:hypothetical protein